MNKDLRLPCYRCRNSYQTQYTAQCA